MLLNWQPKKFLPRLEILALDTLMSELKVPEPEENRRSGHFSQGGWKSNRLEISHPSLIMGADKEKEEESKICVYKE